MAANLGNQRIIPLEEGWNDEIKAKVRNRVVLRIQMSSTTFKTKMKRGLVSLD